MDLSKIVRPKGANRDNKRVGRGTGSGHGTTACRGSKGQKCRAGYSAKPHWEGGQMPLYRVLGKSGFKNIWKKDYAIINLDDIEKFGLEKVDLETLKSKGLATKQSTRVKVLARGELKKAVEVNAHKVSKKAAELIEKTGGKVNIIPEKKFVRAKKSK
jgi:large subunit ribosomal protein L15